MSSGYQQAREHAAFDERLDRGRLLLTGPDAKPFLHALLTNEIAALAPGTGCYAALLTQQGRMIADMDVLVSPDDPAVLLIVHSDVAAMLAGRFDKSIFSEDVTVADVSASTAHFSVVGPAAGEALDRALVAIGHETITSALGRPHQNRTLSGLDADGIVWRGDTFEQIGVPEFNVAVAIAKAEALRAALAREAGPLAADEREILRVEAGRPEFHVDMTEDTIPLEADLLDRAISTSKGCYVGQEVIIRVLHRGGGRVAKRLVSLRFSSGQARVPARGSGLSAEDRQVGRVTSAVWSPHQHAAIGLGYVHRDFAEEGVTLALDDGASATITRASEAE